MNPFLWVMAHVGGKRGLAILGTAGIVALQHYGKISPETAKYGYEVTGITGLAGILDNVRKIYTPG